MIRITLSLTLPSRLAITLVALIVGRVHAGSVVGTGIGRARGEQIGTGVSTVRWLTEAGETGDSIHAGALIQTGAGRTFIDVHLTQVT